MLVETERPDGARAAIVYRCGGPVDAAALEKLGTKVRVSLQAGQQRSMPEPAKGPCSAAAGIGPCGFVHAAQHHPQPHFSKGSKGS